MVNSLVIGIAGGSGSGKTTLAQRLADYFPEDAVMLRHDDYYYSNESVPEYLRKSINYDHPDAFETQLLIEHIEKLKNGESVEAPIYDYTTHNRCKETKLTEPKRIIIIDGILILNDSRLRSLFDISVFVDTDADIRLLRRIQRDIEHRARTLNSITEQYIDSVRPMHEKFVEPSKKYADIIIPGGGYNEVAFELIVSRIEKFLNQNCT